MSGTASAAARSTGDRVSRLLRSVAHRAHTGRQLAEWPHLQRGVTSAPTRVECRRTLDRLRRGGILDADELQLKQERVTELLGRLDVVPLDTSVLSAAAEPLPTPIATLDAIHLVSAVLYREARAENEPPLLLATHDRELADAARALGFATLGA